jgi:hypothetical protein
MVQGVSRTTSSLVLCAALFACSSKDSGPTSETVTPTGFIVEGLSPFTLLLSWEPPTAPFDGYRLEVTDGSQPLQQIGTELIPPAEKAVRLVSRSGIPEAVHLRFALTAIRQGQPIGPAAIADFIEPLLAVYDLGALLVDGGILLTWKSGSLRAEQVEIFRVHLEAADGGPPDRGFPVVQGASSTSYLDALDPVLSEGSNYLYSVILHGASTVSNPTTVQASVPLLSPTELSVIGRASGVDLSWKSPSRAATELVLERAEGFANAYLELVHLPADAGSYRDVPPSPGVYSYLLEARRPGSQPGWLANSGVAPPRGDLLFDAALVDGPIGSTAVRDASGRWTVCGGQDGVADLTGQRTAFVPSGLRYWATPCVLLDSGGLPHAVYGTAPTNLSSETLWHAWFDGTTWQTEEIATRAIGFGYPAFAVDDSGGVHVVWQQWGMNPAQGFEYAHRTAGGWPTEEPGLPLTSSEFIWDLQVDRSGTVHVLMAPELDLLERAPGGAWSNALIPVGVADAGLAPLPAYGQIRLRGDADLTVFFVRNGIEIATRRDGGWSVPEPVAPHLMAFTLPIFVAAAAREGSRLAVAFESSDQQTLFIEGPGGSLRVNLGGTEPYVAGLSFDADGGLHGLQYLSNILPSHTDWLHYGTFDEVQPSP